MVLLPSLRASVLHHRCAGSLRQVCLGLRPSIKDRDRRKGKIWSGSAVGHAGHPDPPPLLDHVLGPTGGYAALLLVDCSKMSGCGMSDLGQSLVIALRLIGTFDPELVGIVALSLRVSLSATAIAFLIGAPAGGFRAIARFRGRTAAFVLANALLGLPPVVMGLIVYLLLSRSGPLGGLGLLFTPTAMIIAQACLAMPIVIALVHRTSE